MDMFEKVFKDEYIAKKHQDSFDAYDLYQRTIDLIERAYGRNKKVIYRSASTKDSEIIGKGTYGITG